MPRLRAALRVRTFYVRAYRALLPPHVPDMLTVRIQVIDGTGTFTLSDSQPCRLLTLPQLLSLNGGAIDRPKNVPDGLQNRYPARG
jgi:hypothetical protein